MPLNISKKTDLYKSFIKKNLGKPKLPPKATVDVSELSKTRDYRLIVREAAVRRVQCVLLYRKITTGEVKRYTVCPMSYRYRKLRSGLRKVLFLKDVGDKRQLKMFVLRNIKQAILTAKPYIKLDYPVEIN